MTSPVPPPSLPPVAVTDRLRMPLWTADDVAAIRAGGRRQGYHPDYPRPDDRDAAALWRDGDTWGPRHVVRGVTALGSIGFFGSPEPAADGVLEAEVGVGLVAEARGYGFATEALRGLLALTDAAGVRVRASVEPTHQASLRVLAKAGLTGLRGADEDGRLVMVRPLPVAAP
ncbi:GNAT family N-acetyltransferase [Nocardioides perillae]|uniref:RimJ/RimL family protein N-acetyltransferase n=1 Tax=Nocardioides perillae TaxID=1119534 RepID=A0A7Y9RTD4_9ACTN|nr:RimJ/RimL family protein N-acetyltransferase [Nocardioides perillae]